MEQLLRLDTQLFFWLNGLPHTPFLNALALFLSGIGETGFIWFFLGIFLIFREEKKDNRFFIPLVVGGFLSWISSELLLKNFIERLRPSSAFDAAIVVGGYPLGYAFPSTHTVFAFALATILVLKEPRWKVWLYILAVLVGMSRIYIGAHFPTDVIAGAFLGFAIGTIVVIWYKGKKKTVFSTPKKKPSRHRKKRK